VRRHFFEYALKTPRERRVAETVAVVGEVARCDEGGRRRVERYGGRGDGIGETAHRRFIGEMRN